MKQQRENKSGKCKAKGMILWIVVAVIIAQMQGQTRIYAESNIAEVTLSAGTEESQTIEVENLRENIRRITLMQESEVIATKEVSDVLTFEVYTNGKYEIIGYDEEERIVGEQTVTVDTFEALEVHEEPTQHEVTILSRDKATYQITISGVTNQVLDAVERHPGVYQTVFTVKENGTYTFSAVDKNGKVLKEKTMNISDVPEVLETGEIILNSEEDFQQIIRNPKGHFVLGQNIEVEGTPLKGSVFQGTFDGNGYKISGGETLFGELDHASIKNVVIQGQLAETSRHSVIENTGYYVEGNDTKQDYAILMNSENTTIRNSFVMMNAEGRAVAGFVLSGTANIKDSYVSGYLSGERVYGFGKDIDVENSYISASLTGEQRILFSEGKRTDCFYDAQINDLEEEGAEPYLTDEITSGTLNNEAFIEKEGSYPQIKTETAWKEQAQKAADLSVVCVESESNLSAMTDSVHASEQKDNAIEWNRSLVRSVRENSEITASVDDMQNRFVLRAAAAPVSISAGKPTTSTETEITYPVSMGTYYIVQKSSDSAPVSPKTHKEAIDNGWKRMYWDGSYTLSGLEWNTAYTVYETDLNSVKESNTITTNHGKNKGTLSLSGTYAIGETMTATLSDTNTMKGSLYWESAETSDAEAWTVVQTTIMSGTTSTDTYTVTDTLSGKYLRARFVTEEASGYTGTLQDISAHSVKVDITKIEIVNSKPKTAGQYTLTDELKVKISPDKLNDATYAWYQEGKEEAIGTGMNYTIKGSDVGKKLYVKATAKADGELSGAIESSYTTEVQSIQCTTPNAAATLTDIMADDITVKVKINESDGLYRIGIQKEGESEIQDHAVSLRGGSDTTITGLDPNTKYKLYVKEIGEEGYTDSEWSSDFKAFTTDKRHVQGDIKIDGELIYGETVRATVSNIPDDQDGEVSWYRLKADGSRDESTKKSSGSYKLEKEDVNQKIEVVYSGTGTYAGEISFVSDVISRAEKAAPTQNLTIAKYEDTTITVKMPMNVSGEKYIIGRSTMETGVPVEEVDDKGEVKILKSGEEFTITGLERDTTYYFSVRFAQSETHQKSDWTAQNIIQNQKTNKKEFKGTITFTYSTGDLLRGQTLTATLAPEDRDFNYQGEWTWTKIASDGTTETPITNYTLAESRGSTSYVIPENEEIGTRYKVTYKATVGYEGSATPVTSNPVKEKEKSKYTTPKANDIIMETIDDMSFKVRMSAGEGQYQFEYKKADTNALDSLSGWFNVNVLGGTDGYTAVGDPVNSNVDVVVDGLDRNTTYTVRVKRIEDSGGLESNYANSSDKSSAKTVTTAKTTITGYVTIAGTAKYKETLTAEYHSATYASTGGSNTDEEGTWQWYRGNTAITGATKNTYSLTGSDTGEKITAKYTMPSDNDFIGSTEETIEKILKASPDEASNAVVMKVTGEKEDSRGNLVIGVETTSYMMSIGGYFRVQKQGMEAPSAPTSDAEVNEKWGRTGISSFNIGADCTGAPLEPNETYIIYYMSPENLGYTASSMHELVHTMGTKQQTGSIEMSGNYVEGKTLTATLKDSNNTKGTWKWYSSNDAYDGSTVKTMPSLNDSAKWTELTEGYTPMSNSPTSQLTLTDNLFGKYIKVEFVADKQQGYSGTMTNPVNNSGFIKKVYEETVTLTSSTSDGNGKPKAYAGTTLTGTVNNPAESSLNRTTVRFKIGGTYVNGSKNGNNTFTYTIPTSDTSTYTDGAEVTAEVSKPKVVALYVDKNMKALDSSNLNSNSGTGSTGTYVNYARGIPIKNVDDLINFVQGTGNYADRSASAYYIMTNNIVVNKEITPAPYTNLFRGRFNGDFHSISGMENPLIVQAEGTSSKYAVLENTVFIKSNITSKYTIQGIDDRLFPSSAVAIVGGGYLTLNNLLLVDANVAGGADDAGMLGGSLYRGPTIVENCGAARGNLVAGISLGGLIGPMKEGKLENCFSINSQLNGSYISGLAGGAYPIQISNSFSSASMVGANSSSGGIARNLSDSSANNYYDSTVVPGSTFNRYPGTTKDVPKSTMNMVGNSLKGLLDKGVEGSWVFKDGFYPQIAWMEGSSSAASKISLLYSATRGAFTSVDGLTSKEDLFNGKIKGVIQIPEELMGEGFSAKLTNNPYGDAHYNSEHGTLQISCPTDAVLEITYTDPDTKATASNTFEFTGDVEMESWKEMEEYTHPCEALIGNANDDNTPLEEAPFIGLNLGIEMQGSPHTRYEENTYQWYRRKSGSKIPEKISGATDYEYKVTEADLGSQITCWVTPKKEYTVDKGEWYYFGTFTPYTQTVYNVDFDRVSLTTSSPTDSSVTVKVNNGSSAYKYEYAYEQDGANAKIIVDGTYSSTDPVKIENLSRNKTYRFYVRVAAGEGYEAGAWSPYATATTLKTDVIGDITLGKAVNNGSDLTMSIDKLNGQTGTWKIERLDVATGAATLIENGMLTNSYSYTLQTADVGSKIRVTFTGSGDYQSSKTATTSVIKKTSTSLPSDQGEFNLVSETDTSLTATTPNKTSQKIDVGYSDSANGEIKIITPDGGIAPGTNVPLNNLDRNKDYYFSYRIAETGGAEASSWSKRTRLTTAQTAVKNAINVTGTQKVDQTIEFTLSDSNHPTGTWVLSSTKNGKTITITPELYTVDTTNNTLSYKVQPKDAGGTLTATFNGTKDFDGSATKTSGMIGNASQDIRTDMPASLNVTEITDHSMKVTAVGGTANYQFAYRKNGEETWHQIDASVTAGTVVTMEGLERNTTYRIGVRKSAKTGYDASAVKEMQTVTTIQTKLNGLVDYVKVVDGAETAPKIGVAEVNQTYKATYHKGSYPQTAADDTAGHWQWYADKAPIEGATSATYTIEPMNGSPEISVRYIANEDSDFSDEVIGRVGTLTKPLYDAPSSLPTVTALAEDGDIRSKMKIMNAGDIDAVYYYVQKASNQKVPDRIYASDADKNTTPAEDKWFKATANVTLTLDANTDYVVYLAKLEDGSHQASGVVSQRAVRTKKEDLSKISTANITETNADIWKVEETKEIRLTNHNEAPTGVWQYYVSPDKTKDNSWINITAQIKASNTSKTGYTATTFSVPVKYNGYYVKAVFSGRGNYEGSQLYVSEEALIGTQIKGHAEIAAGNASEVLVPIEVNYVFAKENGKEVVDEINGQWTWYRVKDGTTTQIMNEDGTPYGKTGRSDSYTPGKEDVGAKIYAQYTSARNGIYSGSVKTSQLSSIERTAQTVPDAPTEKQVRGITMQMNLPTNYRSDGTTIPETVLKYREQGTTKWIENTVGESWIGKGSDS